MGHGVLSARRVKETCPLNNSLSSSETKEVLSSPCLLVRDVAKLG